ncbi:MAG: protein kinase [Bacteroidales bacterium]|jgi:serine/threonine protein kinase|nr:protein kinase [Bacteroidales bacterium]
MIQQLSGKTNRYTFNTAHKADVISTGERYFHVFRGKSEQAPYHVLIKQCAQPQLIHSPAHALLVEEILLNINKLHPNIAPTLDVVQHNGTYYIMREYVQGVSLHNVMFDPDYKTLRSAPFLLEITRQLCEITAALHAHGIVQRNIKPTNIILESNELGYIDTENPRIQLVDFERIQVAGTSMLNFARLPISRSYSSPEMVLQQANLISTATDIYSIGIVLFELFAHVPAYNTPNQNLILNMQVAFPLKKTPEMPKELFAILHKAAYKHVFRKPPTHYDAKEVHAFLKNAITLRYTSALDVYADIREFFTRQSEKKRLFGLLQ